MSLDTARVRQALVMARQRDNHGDRARQQLLASDGLVAELLTELDRIRREVSDLAGAFELNAADLDHRSGQAQPAEGEGDMLDALAQLYLNHATQIRKTLI